jgi:MFS family permease
MTQGTAGVARHTPVRALGPSELRRVVAVLCFTQIVSWGILFYAFPVLVTTISGAEGWSLTSLVAVLTGAQLVAAGTGIWVGRHIDRHGPRRVMTAGSAIGVASVVAVAAAPSLTTFALAWVGVGLAMSATLYLPAFAVVTHWAGASRVKALTAVTLVGGFASTVFAPLTALLVGQLSWRQTYLVLAVVLCATVPAHWWGLRAAWVVDPTDHERDSLGQREVASPPRREFLLLAAALTLGGFCVYAVVVNLVPLLTEGGLTTGEAAVALGIGGVGQVAGRLLYGPVLTQMPVRARMVTTLLAGSLTTIGLATVHDPLLVVGAVAFAAGTARGIFTLIKATAVADRWGTAAYGARRSLIAGSVTAVAALAPWACAAIADVTGSFAATFLLLGGLAAVAAALTPRSTQPKRPEM